MMNTKPARKGTKPATLLHPTSEETVGRKYKTTRYGVHSRRLGGDGTWYGLNNHTSLEDAKAHLAKMGVRYVDLGGGLTLDFKTTGTRDVYEYRIVKVESEHEVLSVTSRKL